VLLRLVNVLAAQQLSGEWPECSNLLKVCKDISPQHFMLVSWTFTWC